MNPPQCIEMTPVQQPTTPINNQIPQNYPFPQQQPFQPVQSYPYLQNNVGSAVPLLVNQDNYSLETIECFEDLNGASEAIITKYVEGYLLRDAIYDISIKYKNGGFERHIFIGKRSAQNRYDLNMFRAYVKYIPRAANYTTFIWDKNYEKRFFDAITTHDPISGCSSPQTLVFLVENNTTLGDIRQPNVCCCSDPDYQIKNIKSIKYRVVTNGCQCSYCCCNGCSCMNSGVRFNILDSTHTQIVGDIFRVDYLLVMIY